MPSRASDGGQSRVVAGEPAASCTPRLQTEFGEASGPPANLGSIAGGSGGSNSSGHVAGKPRRDGGRIGGLLAHGQVPGSPGALAGIGARQDSADTGGLRSVACEPLHGAPMGAIGKRSDLRRDVRVKKVRDPRFGRRGDRRVLIGGHGQAPVRDACIKVRQRALNVGRQVRKRRALRHGLKRTGGASYQRHDGAGLLLCLECGHRGLTWSSLRVHPAVGARAVGCDAHRGSSAPIRALRCRSCASASAMPSASWPMLGMILRRCRATARAQALRPCRACR